MIELTEQYINQLVDNILNQLNVDKLYSLNEEDYYTIDEIGEYIYDQLFDFELEDNICVYEADRHDWNYTDLISYETMIENMQETAYDNLRFEYTEDLGLDYDDEKLEQLKELLNTHIEKAFLKVFGEFGWYASINVKERIFPI